MFPKTLRKLIVITLGILVLGGGCNSLNTTDTDVISNASETDMKSVSWQKSYIPEFGISYSIPPGAEIVNGSPHLNIVDEDGDHLFSLSTLNSDHTSSIRSYPIDAMNWQYFLSHQPVEGVTYQDVNLSWKQYHAIKDTFTPNENIGGIPMYIETNYGKLHFYYNDLGEAYYYRAHFFIQDGLNYVRLTFPIKIPEDSKLSKLDTNQVLAALRSDSVDANIKEQKQLFYDVLSKINIVYKFDKKNDIVDRRKDIQVPSSLFCIDGGSEDIYRSYYKNFKWASSKNLDYFFNDERIQQLLDGNTLYQLCFRGHSSDNFYFVIYRGGYEKIGNENNIIGMWSQANSYGGLVTTEVFNQPMGDIGLCSITGFIESNIVYSCGGGDGPFAHNVVYLFDVSSERNIAIKNCEYDSTNEYDSSYCSKNVFGLEE